MDWSNAPNFIKNKLSGSWKINQNIMEFKILINISLYTEFQRRKGIFITAMFHLQTWLALIFTRFVQKKKKKKKMKSSYILMKSMQFKIHSNMYLYTLFPLEKGTD